MNFVGKEWLTIQEVAQMLGCAVSTAYKRTKSPLINTKYDTKTGVKLYWEPAIRQYIKLRKRGNPRLCWDSEHQRAAALARWQGKKRRAKAPVDRMPKK